MRRHVVRLLGVTVLLVTGLAALPGAPAGAAVTTGPTAVAVVADGTTYVGTAAGGSLQRIDATGVLLAPIALPRSGPVDGLAVDPDGASLWVSYGSGASQISLAGTELRYFDASFEPTTCAATDTDDPATYGGIAVSADRVVLTHRCGPGIGLHTYARSDLQARGGAQAYDCTGDCRYGDVAFSSRTTPQSSQGSWYVTVPGQAEVEVWAGFDNVHGTPYRTITIAGRSGWATPRPTGITVDDEGTMFVTDSANHVVYVYDASGNEVRYIGNPPDADDNDYGFDTPVAIAQYPRNGPLDSMRGNLLVADSGNNRIVRRDTYTYRYWDAYLDGSGGGTPSTAPINTTLPTVTGTPAVGQTLTCEPGTWAGAPDSYDYGWNRNGSYLPGVTGATYVVPQADSGQKLSCFVRATNAAGTSDYATSAKVTIASTPPAASTPVNTIRPTIAGTPQPGQTLGCGNGSWTGSPAPTYTQQWLRDGTPIAGATSSSYLVLDADLGTQLACRVTATNTQGSATAQSAPVTVTSTPPTSSCPGAAGVSINSAALYTTSASVSLRIRPPAGATQVLVSNDGGFDTAAVRALSADCTYPWTLTGSSSRDAKVVYVRFAGGGVDELTTLSDDVVLDTLAPALPRPTVARTGAKTFKVTLRASDRTTAVARVQYAAAKGARGTTVAYRSTFTTRTPAKFTWFRVYDRAGNVSVWKKSIRR